MKSYSIAVIYPVQTMNQEVIQALDACRQTLPFASVYVYCEAIEDQERSTLQKMDVMIRYASLSERGHLVRRVFTEIDADIFVFCGQPHYAAKDISSMIHQLVEGRNDMVSAVSNNGSLAPKTAAYQAMCRQLYGRTATQPLSDFRVFSRRYVKSFASFDRGFPIELEWDIHAMELDIPTDEYVMETMLEESDTTAQSREWLARLILHLQARPLKWFGLATGLTLCIMLCYKLLFCLQYFDVIHFLGLSESALGAGVFAILSFVSALSGLTLHSISHQRRELKRLHFQQHSTL